MGPRPPKRADSDSLVERRTSARLAALNPSAPEFPGQRLLNLLEDTRPGEELHRPTSSRPLQAVRAYSTGNQIPITQANHPRGPRAKKIAVDHESSNLQTQFKSQKSSKKPKAPTPTPTYLALAFRPPTRLASPQPLLIITDLNGTLLFRPSRHHKPKDFIPRPGLEAFLSYLLSQHSMMVWSSAKPENVSAIVNALLPQPNDRNRLVVAWGRDRFGLTATQYNNKTQVYKELGKVWGDASIKHRYPLGTKTDTSVPRQWGQHNTVLIDDSILKAASEPHNLVEIPEFSSTPDQRNESILEQVIAYLEEAKCYSDVSTFMRETPFRANLWVVSPELKIKLGLSSVEAKWEADVTIRGHRPETAQDSRRKIDKNPQRPSAETEEKRKQKKQQRAERKAKALELKRQAELDAEVKTLQQERSDEEDGGVRISS